MNMATVIGNAMEVRTLLDLFNLMSFGVDQVLRLITICDWQPAICD